MTVKQWLGEDNKLGQDIWEKKYKYKDETFDEWVERVSGGDKDVKRLILEKKFLFGGRTLASRGTGNGLSFSNCYSSGYAPDSVEGMLELNKKLALTYKASGGQGLSLSLVRPKGSPVKNGVFHSDGIVPFMEIFNQTTASISQGGSRKGALMMSLSIWHPEIETFISIKDGTGKITKANLSVEIDDEFMQLVKDGVTEYTYVSQLFGGTHTINPVALYDKIMQRAWSSAEPGVIFTNRFRNYNLMELHDEYKIITSNPCVTGDTPILTDKGYFPIIELIDKNVSIWNGYEFSEVKPTITGTNQKILNIELSNGRTLKCTPYHKFILKNGDRVEAKDLNIGDKLIKCGFPVIQGEKELEFAYTQGAFSGDGFVNKDRNAKYISLYGEKKMLHSHLDIVSRRESSDLRDTYNINALYDKDFVPNAEYTILSRLNWLAGIIDTDGSSDSSGNVSISSINKNFLGDIQLMLNTLGVDSTVSVMKEAGVKMMPDGNGGFKEYTCETSHRLLISSYNVLKLKNLGLETFRVKLNANPNRDASRFIYVKSITEQNEIEDKVYCFTEYKNHSGIFNGIITAQCGEQPLPAHGACNLGSINLAEYVINPFTNDAKFDFESFIDDVQICVKALDDVLEEGKDLHALPEQREMAKNYRNIGLGVMGYATMLMKMGIPYGSEDAKQITDEIMSDMIHNAIIKSIHLAKEKGAFPKYDNKILDGKFFKEVINDVIVDDIREYGLRNCSLLSVAPSGSIGTMLDVSTGLEPYYALSYQRKTESLHGDEDVYYTVEVPTAKKAREAFGDEVCVSAMDINWRDRVEVQGIMQNYIDTAISSTVNVPQDTTVEELRDLYLYAWECGLKGITIYREGSFEAILSTGKEKKEDKRELGRGVMADIPDDTFYIPKDIYHGCGKAKVMIGFSPSENRCTDVYYINKGKGGCTKNTQGEAILISQILRTGGNLEDIKKSFAGIDPCSSCTISRMKGKRVDGINCPNILLNLVIDTEEEYKKKPLDNVEIRIADVKIETSNVDASYDNTICPDCGSKLEMSGGCYTCRSCGYSKCN